MRTKLTLVLFLLVLSLLPTSAYAQEGGAWDEVVDEDGNIKYGELVDLGVVTEDADWMPTIPGMGQIQAEYHQYLTASGNIVVMPTATTLFFMALNPTESGFSGASSQLGNGTGVLLEGAGLIKAMMGGYLDTEALKELGYTHPDQFFDDVISGKTSIWTFAGWDVARFLRDLAKASWEDKSFYTMLLLYTQGDCHKVPGGCPVAADGEDGDGGGYDSCLPAQVIPGKITASALLLAPPYPLVVGQDPEKRGVDLSYTLTIQPTTLIFYIPVPILGCRGLLTGETSDCTQANGKPGKMDVIGMDCQEQVSYLPEPVRYAVANAKLSQSSRDWILDELGIRYPGAYLHHPDWSWGGGQGGFQGATYIWTFTIERAQLADPGRYSLSISGHTSGTAVSAGRPFNLPGAEIAVYLLESAIIK